ncbi:MAG: hypothetical protein WCD76_09855, partial [Pyrinomonadaceae bacterium]
AFLYREELRRTSPYDFLEREANYLMTKIIATFFGRALEPVTMALEFTAGHFPLVCRPANTLRQNIWFV